jgi:hypothetical protein
MIHTLVAMTLFVPAAHPLAPAADPKPAEQARPFTGKVLPLGTVLARHGVKLDAAAAAAVALVTDAGTTYLLVKDDASRLLFLDKHLHDRPVKLTARIIPGTHLLKVEKVQTVVKGQVCDIDYWCENCQFANPQPGPCRCCGGETVFRELPAK